MGRGALVGYGDGDGDGYGSGYGSGSGSGYGDGDGSGSGSGSGSGYGDGSGDGYWPATITAYVNRLPNTAQSWVNAIQRQGATIALWRSGTDGRLCNGGVSALAARPGLRESVDGPLAICTSRALHATYRPHQYHGD